MIVGFLQRGLGVVPEPFGHAGSGADDPAEPDHRAMVSSTSVISSSVAPAASARVVLHSRQTGGDPIAASAPARTSAAVLGSRTHAGAEEMARSLNGLTPVQTVRQGLVGAVVVALDQTGMAKLAERYDAVIELVPAVGDHVRAGGTLFNIYGPCRLPERRLRRGVVLGDERTLDDDPATAVQSLDRIEDLLRYAAPKHLSIRIVGDGHGKVWLICPVPTWEDLVELALDEIRAFGAGQHQIARRLRALLDDLIADLPENRRPALAEQRHLLGDAVSSAIPQSQRAGALVPDRQGIGMSHCPPANGH